MNISEINLFFPIISMVLFGVCLRTTGYLSLTQSNAIMDYLMKVPIPMISFVAVCRFSLSDIQQAKHFAIIYTLLSGLFLLGSMLLFRLFRFSRNASVSFSSSIFFPNLVFFSLPIFLSLPNHQQYMPTFAIGVTITMLMFSLIIVPIYQLGQRTSGFELSALQSSLINTLHIPLVVAILAGLACVVIGWRPPALIMHTMDKFGPVLASTGLIILGMNIDSRFFTRFRITVWAAIIAKSILMPLAGVALIPFFPLSSPQVFALVMMVACPTAGIAAMAAKKHSVVSDQIIDIMIGSTLISLMLFPFWLWLARHLS